MTTKAEYDAGAAAVLKIAQADIASEVPQIFQDEIPPAMVEQHARDAAKAAIDAAATVRLKAQQTT